MAADLEISGKLGRLLPAEKMGESKREKADQEPLSQKSRKRREAKLQTETGQDKEGQDREDPPSGKILDIVI